MHAYTSASVVDDKETDRIKLLQHFEYEALLTVSQIGDDAYPAEISRRLTKQLGRQVSIAQVFGTLERLEDKGYVKSQESKPEPVRGGRRRRIFNIQASGTQALKVTAATFSRMSSATRIFENEYEEPSPT
ncbi:PadR family transcriptional regulator [Methylocystis sp. MJC1]|jgi:DNA-binding PadR family transcriptional regulator|uniref:PadR family transcriptional regulator n=1 Tax=Methylocystis sp. MJC1 TaxID=2654282 RepID=UPI0013EDF815|nr:PadR family transcriptional regulator [Methylocystis sp. MJC1]MBU6526178.1 PadR family transcriptional regulator [Methylocystis sp. MJC1]UZX12632.1 PadR family transcriptional regulator [Methylocystis sp. MJC1]